LFFSSLLFGKRTDQNPVVCILVHLVFYFEEAL
jgi:hypothetical protein